MAIPADIMNIFIILMAVIGVESLLLILIAWKTPALIFLKASVFKQPVMYIIGKDHVGRFATFKPKSGAGYVKKVGLFALTENSHTLEMGSKTPLYFAFRDLAATLLPEYPAIIQEIREKGFLVNNLDDVQVYIDKIHKGTLSNYPITIQQYKTYKFHDLANMFPFNLDPTFIDATVECEVSKFIKTMKVAPMVITGVLMALIVAAVAVFIASRAFKGCISANECSSMVSAAKCAVQSTLVQTPIG